MMMRGGFERETLMEEVISRPKITHSVKKPGLLGGAFAIIESPLINCRDSFQHA